ncbi:MAG: hypothetical protein JJ979_02780 [Roseibium sp.]|nr:hypothetical protein [Roseibium sp.]
MRTLEAATENLLAEGRFILRDAILFDFAEGQFAFWWGEGDFSWNGHVFVGAGSLLKVDPVNVASDGSPIELNVTLTAIPNTDLTPDVLGSIETYTYHQRPVRLYRFYFDPDTGAMVGAAPVVLFQGYVDQIPHEDSPDGDYSLVARLVSKSVDYRRTGHLKRGNESQKALNGGSEDLFFEHAAEAGTVSVEWGPQ